MKRVGLLIVLLGLIVAIAQLSSPVSKAQPAFPETIELPDGFRPEGLAIGRKNTAYTGSVATGAIYAADLRTGGGDILVAPQSGRVAVGIAFDKRTDYLYVAGGPTGNVYVYDATTGADVQTVSLTPPGGTFVNDPVVTRDAVYLTDSQRPVLYRLALSAGGALANPATLEEIPLGGDFEFVPGEFNANGIEATANGKWLIVVNTFVGALYRVDPATGDATLIDLGGESVSSGDGIRLQGKTLYVVQNFLNQVSVAQLEPGFLSGEITDVITDPRMDIPTSIDRRGSSIYVVNARFSTPPAADTEYTIIRLP